MFSKGKCKKYLFNYSVDSILHYGARMSETSDLFGVKMTFILVLK